MNSLERMQAVRAGQPADRIPFLPTILEHAAAVAGMTPSAAAQDAGLMAEAHVQAWRRYGHDAVTVGIDVYNAEAEALGCEVRFYCDNSVPGIIRRPWGGQEPSGFPALLKSAAAGAAERGRLPLLLQAARLVKSAIGKEVPVGLGVSGPFSVCCELMGFEDFIMTCFSDPDAADALLGTASAFLTGWCQTVTLAGIGITLFESWAAPPLLTPGLYRRFAAPWEKAIIKSVCQSGGKTPSLVIGGNTAAMLEDILLTGTGMVIADYNADLAAYLGAARQAGLILRGNIDPKLVASGPIGAIMAQALQKIEMSGGYPGFVLGTGVLPYDTPGEHVTALLDLCRKVHPSDRG